MALPTPLNPSRTIHGSYGSVYIVNDPGGSETFEFLAGMQNVDARVAVDRVEVRRSGTRRMGYKRGMVSGSGTLTGLKVTSEFATRFAGEMGDDPTANPTIVLESRLEDPEALGSEKVRFLGVKIWELPVGWSVGDLVEEDIPFTFEDYEIIDTIDGDPTV